MARKVISGRQTIYLCPKRIRGGCKQKKFTEILRLYPTRASQCAVDSAAALRAGKAELLHVSVRLEHDASRSYSIADLRFFYRVTAEVLLDSTRSAEIIALAVLHKRTLFFGCKGKQFDSGDVINPSPEAVVVAHDPKILDINPAGVSASLPDREAVIGIPPFILTLFDNELCFENERRRIYVTLSQSIIIRTEQKFS